METLFTLPVDIQIMLVSGFAGFYINTTGKSISNNFIKLFQILVFGTIGAVLFSVIDSFEAIKCLIGNIGSNKYTISTFIITFFASIIVSILWRKCGQNLFIMLMGKLGVYYDDHNETAYDSFINMLNSKNINYIDIELHNGNTLRSYYYILQEKGIKSDKWLAINNEGIALYITSIIDKKSNEKTITEEKPSLTFITSPNIKYITCGTVMNSKEENS